MNTQKIDFVLLWVDNQDEKWLEEKSKYMPIDKLSDSGNRYRDWDILKYWFRAVEKYAPWVNKIYFVTYGHLPKWLNVNHPKLRIVKHDEFIPQEYLPTYNSNVIEYNLKNIKDLSENFVLFNDDVFINNNVKEEDFFINDLPRDEYGETPIIPTGSSFQLNLFHNIEIINKYFNKKECFKNNRNKYINLKYGINNIKTLMLRPYHSYVGFHNPHIAQSFNKSYFNKVWDLEFEKINNTCLHKFRTDVDLTQYLVRYFQLLEGHFIPRQSSFGKYFDINANTIDEIVKTISRSKTKLICLNDSDENADFDSLKDTLQKVYDKKFKDKSTFEI